MLRHRQESIIPRLRGASNYKEWSQKVELHMRIHDMWQAVMSPPKPIRRTTDREKIIYVATRKHIYIQCPHSTIRKAKLFLFIFVEPALLTYELRGMSVPCLWLALKRTYGRPSPEKPLSIEPARTEENASNC